MERIALIQAIPWLVDGAEITINRRRFDPLEYLVGEAVLSGLEQHGPIDAEAWPLRKGARVATIGGLTP